MAHCNATTIRPLWWPATSFKRPAAISWPRTIPITRTCHRIDLCPIKTLRCNEKSWRITKSTCKLMGLVDPSTKWLIESILLNPQRTKPGGSWLEFTGNGQTMWTVRHENARSQRYRRRTIEFSRCPHGHCGIPGHNSHQHILMGENPKDFL